MMRGNKKLMDDDKNISVFQNRLIVISCFALIFAFSSVDHAISPLVDVLRLFYGVEIQKALWLISYCTLGIVVGVFAGPVIIKNRRVGKVIIVSGAFVIVSLAGFLVTDNFYSALLIRFVFGISAGVLSTTMWWIAYHGVSKPYYQPMITVLMAARPMAVALGVPMAGITASVLGWKSAFWLFFILFAVSFAALVKFIVNDETSKTAITFRSFIDEYKEVFSLPYAKIFYLGLMINKMCYFGFYSMAGIWFIRHYNLGFLQIAKALSYVGICEALSNFFIPRILKLLGYRRTFNFSVTASCLLFYVFMQGMLPLKAAVFSFAVFVVLDRIYSMALVIKIPEMFPDCKNKTVMGSLITLTAWTGLTFISWFEGKYLDAAGMRVMEHILFLCLVSGCLILNFVLKKTIIPAAKGL